MNYANLFSLFLACSRGDSNPTSYWLQHFRQRDRGYDECVPDHFFPRQGSLSVWGGCFLPLFNDIVCSSITRSMFSTETKMRLIGGSWESAGTVRLERHTFLMASGMVEESAGKYNIFPIAAIYFLICVAGRCATLMTGMRLSTSRVTWPETSRLLLLLTSSRGILLSECPSFKSEESTCQWSTPGCKTAVIWTKSWLNLWVSTPLISRIPLFLIQQADNDRLPWSFAPRMAH